MIYTNIIIFIAVLFGTIAIIAQPQGCTCVRRPLGPGFDYGARIGSFNCPGTGNNFTRCSDICGTIAACLACCGFCCNGGSATTRTTTTTINPNTVASNISRVVH